jgi:recombination protein RecT
MAEKEKPTWKDLEAALEEIRAEWPNLSTNPRLKFDAEREWVLQACNKTEKTPPIAIGNIIAVQEALRNVAAVGVTLDPARKFSYILQRDGKMVYDLSYMGMLDLATASGAIQWAQARIVHTNDVFELAGYDAPPVHKFKPFAKPEERGEIIGAYVVVKTPGGDYLTATMHADEINAIRERSPAAKAGKGPWKTDWNEMAKKTVVKNAYKYWPRSEALDRAIHYLNTDGGQGIDLPGEDSGIKTLLEGYLKQTAEAQSGTAVATVWAAGRVALKEHPDEYAKLREAIAARNKALGVQPPAKNGETAKPSTGAASGANPAPGAAHKESPKPGSYAHIVDLLKVAETDEALEATGPMIDALPEDQRPNLDVMYNERLAYLNKKFNRAAS